MLIIKLQLSFPPLRLQNLMIMGKHCLFRWQPLWTLWETLFLVIPLLSILPYYLLSFTNYMVDSELLLYIYDVKSFLNVSFSNQLQLFRMSNASINAILCCFCSPIFFSLVSYTWTQWSLYPWSPLNLNFTRGEGAIWVRAHFIFRANCTFPPLSMGSVSISPLIYKNKQCPLLSIGNVQLTPNRLFFC